MRPNKFITLKCTGDSFLRVWIEFLAPFHKLTSRERDVAARVLAQYFKLKDQVSDPVLINEVLWSFNSRKDMRESLGMSQAHFQMILAKLKACGFIEGDSINKRYIPNISEDPRFVLSIIFDWSSPNNPIRVQEQK